MLSNNFGHCSDVSKSSQKISSVSAIENQRNDSTREFVDYLKLVRDQNGGHFENVSLEDMFSNSRIFCYFKSFIPNCLKCLIFDIFMRTILLLVSLAYIVKIIYQQNLEVFLSKMLKTASKCDE